MTESMAGRDAHAARVLLTSIYWSEIEDLLEPDECPVDYVRVGVGAGRGFCYLTDRNLWWTCEQPGGGPSSRGRIPLAGIETIRWADAGRFEVTEGGFETTFHSEFGCPHEPWYRGEFGAATGQPHRRLTRFVWNLAAACGPRGSASVGSASVASGGEAAGVLGVRDAISPPDGVPAAPHRTPAPARPIARLA